MFRRVVTSEMNASAFDVTEVESDLLKGLTALESEYEEVAPAADDGGNYIFVRLGTFDLDRLGPDYDQDETVIYHRFDRRALDGDHYGFVTVKRLTIDGQYPDNTQENRDLGDDLRDVLETDETLFWSRRFTDEVDVTESEDIKRVISHVRRCLEYPWD
jgi:hypothetical protein